MIKFSRFFLLLILLSSNVIPVVGQFKQNLNCSYGQRYNYYYSQAKGTPYLFDLDNVKSLVNYNQKNYDISGSLLDILKDQLIFHTQTDDSDFVSIILNKGLINHFHYYSNLDDYLFVNSDIQEINGKILNKGFIQLIRDDSISLYIKHLKSTKLNQVTGRFYFFYEKKIYLIINDQTIDISNKALLNLNLYDSFKEIRHFLRKNNIKYKNITDKELNILASFLGNLLSVKEL